MERTKVKDYPILTDKTIEEIEEEIRIEKEKCDKLTDWPEVD